MKWEPEKLSQVEKPQTPSSPELKEADDLTKDLQELASLYADGLISEEEHSLLKAQKLGLPLKPDLNPDAPLDIPAFPEKETASNVEPPKEEPSINTDLAAEKGHDLSALSYFQIGLLQGDGYSGYEAEISREFSESTFAAFSASKLTPDNDSSFDIYLFTAEAGVHKPVSNGKIYGSLLLAHEILDTFGSAYEDTYYFLRGGGIYSITDRLALDFECNYPIDEVDLDSSVFLRARYSVNDKMSFGLEMNVLGDYREDSLLFGLRFNQ